MEKIFEEVVYIMNNDYAGWRDKKGGDWPSDNGLNDYANLTSKIWAEGFELAYPTSRLSRIDKGQGMTGVGIEPHSHIP